jgi:hypothetical protein
MQVVFMAVQVNFNIRKPTIRPFRITTRYTDKYRNILNTGGIVFVAFCYTALIQNAAIIIVVSSS